MVLGQHRRRTGSQRRRKVLLNDLMKAIGVLQNRLQEHKSVLEENETRTRMALIDPLLQALGWDTSDPSQVIPEYKVEGKMVDYALLGQNGRAVAVIESKRLNESLDKHMMQMINYANMAGISYAGLTNGDRWELYDVFRKAPIDDRRILGISISDDLVHESVLKLLVLWNSNLQSRSLIEARPPIVDVGLDRKGSNEDEESENLEGDWVSISNIGDPTGKLPPNRIRFEDGSEKRIKYWKDVLKRTASWLASKGFLDGNIVPLNASNNSYIVALDKTHPSGKSFKSPHNIDGTSLVLECHLSAKQIVNRSIKLLSVCQRDLSRVRIVVSKGSTE